MQEEQELKLKYRPTNFDEFYGNENMIASLKSVLRRDKGIPHCILFFGPRGCGKTTLAGIVKDEIGCSDGDFKIYNSANNRGIDTAREIIRLAPLVSKAGRGKPKIYLLDECHKTTNEFQNAILDMLEKPPFHVYFILCTTEPEKLLVTVKSRAVKFEVKKLIRPRMVALLKWICNEEGIELSDKHITEIASCSEGSPRDALTILDSIIDIENEEEAFNAIAGAGIEETQLKEITALLMSKTRPSWKQMAKLIKELDVEPEQVRRSIKKYFGSNFLNTGQDKHYEIMCLFLEPFYNSGREGLIEALYLACQV